MTVTHFPVTAGVTMLAAFRLELGSEFLLKQFSMFWLLAKPGVSKCVTCFMCISWASAIRVNASASRLVSICQLLIRTHIRQVTRPNMLTVCFELYNHTLLYSALLPCQGWRPGGKYWIIVCWSWALQDVLFHACFWTKTLNWVDDSSGEDIEWNDFTVVPSSPSPFQACLAFAITCTAGFVARFLHVSTTFIVCQ